MKRRKYLSLLAAGAVAGTAGCSELLPGGEDETESEPTTTPGTGQSEVPSAASELGLGFDDTVDVVAEYDADPTGEEPVSQLVQQASQDGTLVVFPEGEYLFDRKVDLRDALSRDQTVGFLGEGDVLWTFPDGFNEFALDLDVGQTFISNVDFQIRPNRAVSGCRILTERGFYIDDVTHHGRGIYPESAVTPCWHLRVSDPDATGILRNFTCREGSAWAHYKGGNGRIGVFVSRGRGRIRIVDNHLEEFGNNAVYASRTLSPVQVDGGTFRNNNVCGVRISGKDSYVDGATLVVDPSEYSGPRTREDDSFQLRAVVIEQGNQSLGEFVEPGAEVRNCDIRVENNPTVGPGIDIWPGGRTLTVRDTDMHYTNDGPAIVRASRTSQGRHSPSPEPRWLKLRDVTVTGAGSNFATVVLFEASNSVVEDCCLSQSGTDRDGVSITDSTDCVVRRSHINVTGETVVTDNAEVVTSLVTSGDECGPAPCSPESTPPDTGVLDSICSVVEQSLDAG